MPIVARLGGSVDKLVEKMDTALISSFGDALEHITGLIQNEMPVGQGESELGHLKDTLYIRGAQLYGRKIRGSVASDSSYFMAVWKGEEGREITGDMAFHLDDWPQWSSSGGAIPNAKGWFRMNRIWHVTKSNDFVERGLININAYLENLISLRIKVILTK